MRAWSRAIRHKGHSIGFVPTMGKLHDGHLSLVRAARARCDRVVVSIFVNPTQFGSGEDYEAYPRDLRRDKALCRELGTDVIFAPSVKGMYEEPVLTSLGVPQLQATLCGKSRPGHFDGVCLVVSKLLNIVDPSDLFLGRKDAQQAIILSRMVRELSFDVKVRIRPTVRERDGLAMSSRNAYLSPEERAYAPSLYQALRLGKSLVEKGERSASAVRARMLERIEDHRARVDYVEVVDEETLQPATHIEHDVMLALAVHVGPARLIDNVAVKVRAGKSARRRRRSPTSRKHREPS